MESNYISRVKALKLPKGQYMVCGSAIMELLGIRKAGDIDLLVLPELFEALQKQGWKKHPKYAAIENEDNSAGAKVNLDFMKENYTLEELLPKATVIVGVPFMSLEMLRDAKVQMNREKDLVDIKLIDEYLKKGI